LKEDAITLTQAQIVICFQIEKYYELALADADVSLTVQYSLVSSASTIFIATSCCLFKVVALGGSGQQKIIFPFLFLVCIKKGKVVQFYIF